MRRSDNEAPRLEQWVDALLSMPPDKRAEAAREMCGDDEPLLARLLDAVNQVGHEDLERRLHDLDITASLDDGYGEDMPERIGPYRLLEKLGEGGFGLVFVAEQTEPVRRAVAIKLIKPGMDSRAITARFEAERQALALMEHPNIARVFDAGATETGRPYFVMELVRGIPITEYCDKHQLPLKVRLELFIAVCQAIQHAHQKGIIHRDIKPSNVLVASHDGKPMVKVIDFGVAKALHQRLTERTVYTSVAQMVGTPLYMSPEQAEMDGLDIDTRSDVYSLGVLLYELLTGTTPLEKKRLTEAIHDDIRRIIRDESPPRPSTRLSESNEIATIAARRHTEPVRLLRLMRGDLDWVVMKALEKDRTRRYDTARDFARDVERYLANEPVEACPPSTAYRLRKFARKHRGELTVVAAIAALLVAGSAVSTWQAVRATRAERTTLIAKQQAEKRLAQLEKSNEIITSIFIDLDMLQVKEGTEPLSAVLAERLVKASEQLEGEAVGEPLATARLQVRLARSLITLGHASAAIPLYEKSWAIREAQLGPGHVLTISSRTGLATAYLDIGKGGTALPLCEENLRLAKAHLSPGHHLVFQALNDLGTCYWAEKKLDLALPLFEELSGLVKARRGPGHPQTLMSDAVLAFGYKEAGMLDRAIPLFEETIEAMKLKMGRDQPHTLNTMWALATSYREAGQLDLAIALSEETLRLSEAKLGAHHPDTFLYMNALAEAHRDAGDLVLALPLFHAASAGIESRGFGHWHAQTIINNLIDCYVQLGELEQAEPWRRKWLAFAADKDGADSHNKNEDFARFLRN